MDSPGHIDFIFEVMSALKLSDGAILVVDVIEGVSTQTINVIQKLIEEDISCILLLNKIDKLYSLGFSITEASQNLYKVISKVNATMNIFLRAKIQQILVREPGIHDEEQLEKQFRVEDHFNPIKNNVIFGSVLHGWGFHLPRFAKMLSPRLKVEPAKLYSFLWGEYYFDPKTRKILKKTKNTVLIPMFEQYVLKPIWAVYKAMEEKDAGMLKKMNKALGLALPERLFRITRKTNVEEGLRNAFMNRWMPIEETVFQMIVRKLPTAQIAQRVRIRTIIGEENLVFLESENSPNRARNDNTTPELKMKTELTDLANPEHLEVQNERNSVKSILNCNSKNNAPLAALISKYILSSVRNIVRSLKGYQEINTGHPNMQDEFQEKKKSMGLGEGRLLLGFCRVLSGKITSGSEVWIKTPKTISEQDKDNKSLQNRSDQDLSGQDYNLERVKVHRVFLLTGQLLNEVQSVPAGNLCGVELGMIKRYKAGFISNLPVPGLNLCPRNPIQNLTKVVITSKQPEDHHKLLSGLRLLDKVDPKCELSLEAGGQLVLAVNGEIHLEKCLRDLDKEFAKVGINYHQMMTSFRETVTVCKYSAKRRFKGKKKKKKRDGKEKGKLQAIQEEKGEGQEKGKEKSQASNNGSQAKENSKKDQKSGKTSKNSKSDNSSEEKSKEGTYSNTKTGENESNNTSNSEETIESEDFDFSDYYDADSRKESENSEEESVESEDEPDEDVLRSERYDSRFQFKENVFVHKKIREGTHELVQRGQKISLQKFDIARVAKEGKPYCRIFSQHKTFGFDLSAVYIGEQTARFLENRKEFMRRAFLLGAKGLKSQIHSFFRDFLDVMAEAIECKYTKVLVKSGLQSFAPLHCGNNLLINLGLSREQTLFAKHGFNVTFLKEENQTLLQCKRKIRQFSKSNFEVLSVPDEFQRIERKKRTNSFSPSSDVPELGNSEISDEFLNNLILEEYLGSVKNDLVGDLLDRFKKMPLEARTKKQLLGFRFSEEHLDNLAYGFNQSCLKGPLCEENLYGVALMVDNFYVCHSRKATRQNIKKTELALWKESKTQADLIWTITRGTKMCVAGGNPKLAQSEFRCTAYCSDKNQSPFCEIVKSNGGRILDLEFQPEVNLIEIKANLPVHQSFGFYGKVLEATSGEVIPQLQFAGWELIDQDPFFEEKMTKEQRCTSIF